MPIIFNAPNGPFAANTTPVVTAQIVDANQVGIPAANLNSLTLSIVDSATGAIINDVSQVDILNTGRGTVDASGNMTITLLEGDTSLSEAPGVQLIQRSLVVDWSYNSGVSLGRGQINFVLQVLAGP